MITVPLSGQLKRFCRECGGHSKLQSVKCEASANAKTQYATDRFPSNGSNQVVGVIGRVTLVAFTVSPIQISQDGGCKRIAGVHRNAHQQAARGRKVIACRKDGGLEYPLRERVSGKVWVTAVAQQMLQLRRGPRSLLEPHADEGRAGPNDYPADFPGTL